MNTRESTMSLNNTIQTSYTIIRVEEDAWLAKNLKNARAFVSRKKEKWTLRDKCEAMRIKQQFEEYLTLYYERTDDELLQEIAKILDFVHFEKWVIEEPIFL